MDYGKCVVCRGTGRTPGLAAALGKVVGLTGVVLTDREPAAWRTASEKHARYSWVLREPGWEPEEHPSILRRDLFDLLAGYIPDSPWNGRRYPTRDAALLALSTAALAFCRLAAAEATCPT